MAATAEETLLTMDPNSPPWVHLVSAFLAMEPIQSLISLSRACGGGSITETVQRFISRHCIIDTDRTGSALYLRSFLKKLIVEIESTSCHVIDELYEQLAFYMTSFKGDNDLAKQNSRVLKQISFLLPHGCLEGPTCPSSSKLVVPLHSSLNMLEGDTGCSIWPSSLFLSEFILSSPGIFSMKSCFEVGSGVGLVGVCLAHVKASKVILSDGDLTSLANLKLNMELNKLHTRTVPLDQITQDQHTLSFTDEVFCMHLSWESACESQLQALTSDIILGADVIYDPSCIPNLVRVLAALLNRKKPQSPDQTDEYQGWTENSDIRTLLPTKRPDHTDGFDNFNAAQGCTLTQEYGSLESMAGPVAYIASVVRNIDTYNYFLMVADDAKLTVLDITHKVKVLDLLPYMLSYQRPSVKLLAISHSC